MPRNEMSIPPMEEEKELCYYVALGGDNKSEDGVSI